MTERYFKSFVEYEHTYFPNKESKPLLYENDSVGNQLATRAVEKHIEKLKKLKCDEKACTGRS